MGARRGLGSQRKPYVTFQADSSQYKGRYGDVIKGEYAYGSLVSPLNRANSFLMGIAERGAEEVEFLQGDEARNAFATAVGVRAHELDYYGDKLPDFSKPKPKATIEREALDFSEGYAARRMSNNGPGGFGGTLARFIGAAGAELSDPLMFGANMIPVIRPARYLKWVNKYGKFSATTRTAVAEGIVGTALTEPFYAFGERSLGVEEYTSEDAFYNLIFGVAISFGLHHSVGIAKDLLGPMSRTAEAQAYAGIGSDGVLDIDSLPLDDSTRQKIQAKIDSLSSEDINDLDTKLDPDYGMDVLTEGLADVYRGRLPDVSYGAKVYYLERLLKETNVNRPAVKRVLDDIIESRGARVLNIENQYLLRNKDNLYSALGKVEEEVPVDLKTATQQALDTYEAENAEVGDQLEFNDPEMRAFQQAVDDAKAQEDAFNGDSTPDAEEGSTPEGEEPSPSATGEDATRAGVGCNEEVEPIEAPKPDTFKTAVDVNQDDQLELDLKDIREDYGASMEYLSDEEAFNLESSLTPTLYPEYEALIGDTTERPKLNKAAVSRDINESEFVKSEEFDMSAYEESPDPEGAIDDFQAEALSELSRDTAGETETTLATFIDPSGKPVATLEDSMAKPSRFFPILQINKDIRDWLNAKFADSAVVKRVQNVVALESLAANKKISESVNTLFKSARDEEAAHRDIKHRFAEELALKETEGDVYTEGEAADATTEGGVQIIDPLHPNTPDSDVTSDSVNLRDFDTGTGTAGHKAKEIIGPRALGERRMDKAHKALRRFNRRVSMAHIIAGGEANLARWMRNYKGALQRLEMEVGDPELFAFLTTPPTGTRRVFVGVDGKRTVVPYYNPNLTSMDPAVLAKFSLRFQSANTLPAVYETARAQFNNNTRKGIEEAQRLMAIDEAGIITDHTVSFDLTGSIADIPQHLANLKFTDGNEHLSVKSEVTPQDIADGFLKAFKLGTDPGKVAKRYRAVDMRRIQEGYKRAVDTIEAGKTGRKRLPDTTRLIPQDSQPIYLDALTDARLEFLRDLGFEFELRDFNIDEFDFMGVRVKPLNSLPDVSPDQPIRVAHHSRSGEGVSLIEFAPPASRKKWQEKAWTKKGREQKDGSYFTPLPEDTFKSERELNEFIITHEYMHSQHPQMDGETKGAYEDRMNALALEARSKPEFIAEYARMAQRNDRPYLYQEDINDLFALVSDASYEARNIPLSDNATLSGIDKFVSAYEPLSEAAEVARIKEATRQHKLDVESERLTREKKEQAKKPEYDTVEPKNTEGTAYAVADRFTKDWKDEWRRLQEEDGVDVDLALAMVNPKLASKKALKRLSKMKDKE